ncbi:MAG: hypothetical protein ACFB3T_05190 [Geminicoccaceae bacterium]
MKLRVAAALAALVVLGACGGGSNQAAETPSGCPVIAIAAGADRFDRYVSGQIDQPSGLAYSGTLSRLDGTCVYDERGLVIDFSVDVRLRKGEAFAGGPVQVDWLVAVIDQEDRVLAREPIRSTLIVSDAQRINGTTELLSQTIPGLAFPEGNTYRVVIGFAPNMRTPLPVS